MNHKPVLPTAYLAIQPHSPCPYSFPLKKCAQACAQRNEVDPAAPVCLDLISALDHSEMDPSPPRCLGLDYCHTHCDAEQGDAEQGGALFVNAFDR